MTAREGSIGLGDQDGPTARRIAAARHPATLGARPPDVADTLADSAARVGVCRTGACAVPPAMLAPAALRLMGAPLG